MNFLMQDFLMAVSNSSYRRKILHKKKNLTQKDIDYLNFEISTEKKDLLEELTQAEQIYTSLEGKITNKKLTALKRQITSLKKKLSDDKVQDDFVQHEDQVVTPPLTHDLNDEIDNLDNEINIPDNVESQPINKPENTPKTSLLNIPPPPEKTS